jgi:glycosyltransferase involved in cell wall biosynthesis
MIKMKKVAILYSGSKSPGGVDSYLMSLFNSYDKKKVELSLISMGQWELTGKIDGTVIISGSRANPFTAYEIKRELVAGGFDLVVSQGMVANFYARLASLISGVPNLVTIHSDYKYDYPSFLRRNLYVITDRMLRFRTKKYIAVSDYLKRVTIKTGVKESNIRMIYNGVELDIKTNSNGNNGVVIGTMGRLHKVKNFSNLIMAMKGISEDVTLNIYGDGGERALLEKVISDNNLQGRVKLCGRKDLSEIFSSIDAYIQPSLAEGFGIAVVQAMLSEKPVIVTPGGALKELIDAERGYLAGGFGVKEIEEVIKKALEDKNSWANKAERAKEFARANFKTKEWAEKTVDCYLEATK